MEYLASKAPGDFHFTDILYEKQDWVARVTINRPESFNCYTTFTLQELKDRFLTQAKAALPDSKLLQAVDWIYGLEDVRNVKEITRLLCAEDPETALL